jgi:hypothetical protein
LGLTYALTPQCCPRERFARLLTTYDLNRRSPACSPESLSSSSRRLDASAGVSVAIPQASTRHHATRPMRSLGGDAIGFIAQTCAGLACRMPSGVQVTLQCGTHQVGELSVLYKGGQIGFRCVSRYQNLAPVTWHLGVK